MTAIKKFLISYAIKASLALACGFGFFPYALAGGPAVQLLSGGSVVWFGRQNHVVFPAESFRSDSFDTSSKPIDFAAALGITYDDIIDPNTCYFNYLFHDVSLGFNIYWSHSSRDGTVLEYNLPDFANSSYDMNLEHVRLMLDTELDFRPIYMIMPFIMGGIGVAKNTLNFKNTPFPNIGADGGFYSLPNNTQLKFAYEVGAGIKVPIRNCIVFSVRYLYANAGQAESGKWDDSTEVRLRKPISINVISQSILFGLSYSFG